MSVQNIARFIWRRFHLKMLFQQASLLAHAAGWAELRWSYRGPQEKRVNKPLQILIVPPDPLLISASKGDEAMLTVVINRLRAKYVNCELNVVVAEGYDHSAALDLGLRPHVVLGGFFQFFRQLSALRNLGFEKCILIGADVLDGSYDPVFSARLLMILDVLSRSGAKGHTTGFSFSLAPHGLLRLFYNNMHSELVFLLRDPNSLKRFQIFTKAPSKLVADVAFSLEPVASSSLPREIIDWIARERNCARRVLGVNFHPLLLSPGERHRIEQLVKVFATAINELVLKHQTSVVLIEHDFRGTSADRLCFDLLKNHIDARAAAHVFRPEHPLGAAQIKALVGLLNGVVTGRMHLLIASIGMSAPAISVEYKDKMSGLLSYFNSLGKHRLNAKKLMNGSEDLLMAMQSLLAEEESIRLDLQRNLPQISSLSRLNLEF